MRASSARKSVRARALARLKLGPRLGSVPLSCRSCTHISALFSATAAQLTTGAWPTFRPCSLPIKRPGKHAGRDHDVGAALDQRTCAGDKILDHASLRGSVSGERIGEILRLAAKTGHVDHAITEAVTLGLLVVPDLEDGIERHKTEPPTELRGRQQRRLAGPDHGNVERRAQLVKSGILEMPHDEGVEPALLRRDAVVDRLDGAAQFGKPSELAVRRTDALDVNRRA